MEDIENWFRQVLRQKEQDGMSWFLNRPSIKLARETGMKDLA